MAHPEYLPSALPPIPRETEPQRQVRIQRERELVAKARADIDAGLGTEWPAIEAWLNELDMDASALPPLPIGGPRRR